jgi:hypothetical protein
MSIAKRLLQQRKNDSFLNAEIKVNKVYNKSFYLSMDELEMINKQFAPRVTFEKKVKNICKNFW